MPPRPRVTRDMIVDAAFAIARSEGAERINARSVSERLGCSTQPVMYHFARIEDLKRAVYEKTDEFHTACLLHIRDPQEGPLLGIGLNYIRFSVEEPHLFRFLFQSGFAAEKNLLEMMDSDGLKPLLSVMGEAMGADMRQTKEIFTTIALFTHGCASLIANNGLEYDEKDLSVYLERAYRGAALAAREEET